ncbi:MAG: hypothetical protein L0Y44_11310 [Phycisphaerales bacterium]|nr:hypothetical protein [Phycisphaerales bacterium]MCI0631227.1 hypothetical protein [Phycisphaerales bacterium]MCI0675249.1 hypothetical protein [Phycisphaerales bacterium]
MHEKRNFIMVLLLIGSIVWAVVSWVFLSGEAALHLPQRIASLLLILSLAAWLFYAIKFEDKLPDHLSQIVGQFYYEADGLSFMPMVRVRKGQAELCVYYQNRYENPVEAIVHLRPPQPGESFVIKPGTRDVHFAFRAGGGDFGVIHQPIAVPRHVQSQVIAVQMAASSWYPRSQGACLRHRAGMPCGTVLVDWVGNPLKIGVHEVSDEIPLTNPVTLRLAMPEDVSNEPVRSGIWRQEQLAAGAVALA